MTQFHFSNDGSYLRVDSTVTSIHSYSIQYELLLTTVELPNSVTSINSSAFRRCYSLKEIHLSDGLRFIGEEAFEDCTSLSQINIPSGVTELGKYAFRGCNSLKDIHLPEVLQYIDDGAFEGCTSLSRVNIPSGVTELGNYAFDNCKSLKEVHLSDGLKIVGEYSFRNCVSLTRIKIPSSVHTISNNAFDACILLKEVHLCDGLKTIGSHVFRECTSLRQIDIPATVKSMGRSIFEGCTALKEVHLSDGLQSIPSNTFKHCTSLLHINIPSSVTKIDVWAFRYCPYLRNIGISPSSTLYFINIDLTFSELHNWTSVDQLKARFDDLPIHRLCFFHSHQSVDNNNTYELLTKMVEQLPDHCTKVDFLDMTPLHILACSSKHDQRLYRCIIDSCPESVLAKDRWGETPLTYLFLSEAPNEIIHYVLEAFKRMSDEMPLDFCTILNRLVTSDSAEYVRRMIQIQKVHFPGLIVDWHNVLGEFHNPAYADIDLGMPEFRLFMYRIYQVYQVIVEARISSLFNSMSPEHRQELDVRILDICDRRIRALDEFRDPPLEHPNAFNQIETLTTHYVHVQLHHDFMMDASVALELAIWNWALIESSHMVCEVNRMDVRSKCGHVCQVVIPNVLSFLQFVARDRRIVNTLIFV
jgi:hypothetical protein